MRKNSIPGIIFQVAVYLFVCAATVFLCLITNQYDNKYTAPGPRGTVGVLVLTGTDLLEYPIIHLVDGWEYYPGQLLEPIDFADVAPVPAEYIFIGQYGGFEVGNQSPHGSASYRLSLDLPVESHSYTLELPEIFSAYRLYINGDLAASMGDPDPSGYVPETGNRAVTFEAAGRAELLFAVSDFTHFYSGMVYPPAFGEPQAVSHLLSARLIFRAALCFIALAIGALSVLIGLLNRKDPTALLYGLLCLFTVGYACYPITQTLFSGTPLTYALEKISFCAILTIVMVLQRRIGSSPGKRDAGKFFILAGAVACALSAASPAVASGGRLSLMLAYSELISSFEWLTAGYITFSSLRAVLKGEDRAAAILCGALILDCALIMDRALPLFEPIVYGWFPELASFAMVLCIGASIGKEVAEQYRARAILAERMAGAERLSRLQLEHYHRLEQEIETSQRIRHDLRHHFVMMDGLVKNRDFSELEHYISDFGSLSLRGALLNYCENRVINTLLCHYANTAAQNGIQFEASCRAGGELSISDADLCCIISNLFENAVEACLRVEEDNVKRFIRVGVTCEAGVFAIKIANSTARKVSGYESFSSKRDDGHGYGIESVKDIAGRYGGGADFRWSESEQVFYSDVTIEI